MVKELSTDTLAYLNRIEEEARKLSSPVKEVRKLTDEHLGYLGAEHHSLEELRSELAKVTGSSKEERNFRKIKSLLKWVIRGERRDFRRENRIFDRVKRILRTADSYVKLPELNDHLDQNGISKKVSELLKQFLVFHNDLTKELSSRGELWKDVQRLMNSLERIETLTPEVETELATKHRVVLIELDRFIEKVINKVEQLITGMQTVLKEMNKALKTLINSVSQESNPEFLTGIERRQIDEARTLFPKMYELLIQHGKLNAAFERGTFNPWKAEQLAYVLLYKERRWQDMDQIYEENVQYRTKNHVPPANPYLLFNILDGSGHLQRTSVREEIFTHPSYFFRRYILLPAVIHYGWKMGWKIGQNNVKIIMKASGRNIPLLTSGKRTVRYADEPKEKDVYDMDSGIIAFAHPFNDSIDGGGKYGYSADSHDEGLDPIYVGFIFKKPPVEKMLQGCGYKYGSFIIPHSVFLTKDYVKEWLELTKAYKIFVKQAR